MSFDADSFVGYSGESVRVGVNQLHQTRSVQHDAYTYVHFCHFY